MCATSWAFDGTRKGFVLGGGLGFSPVTKWSGDGFYKLQNVNTDETKAGVGVQIIAGYAWDEHNMIVYELNGTGYRSGYLHSDLYGDKRDLAQLFDGASWYHYFGPAGRSAFTTVGVGLFHFQVGDDDSGDPGGAIQIGGGYEFARHFQFGLYISSGKSSLGDADFTHSQISFLVSGMAF
jgi:hypothetical protein